MGWTLRLVRTDDQGRRRTRKVCDLGEIAAPAELDDVGLSLEQAKAVLASLQQAVVQVQEEALAARARAALEKAPGSRLKDYRVRSVDTLFGRVGIRVPRLVSPERGGGLTPMMKSAPRARSTAEYDRVRGCLSAWMSYRAATDLLAMLLPVEAGAAVATFHRRTQGLGQSLLVSPPAPAQEASEISLALDTTFIRSNSPDGERGWEILIGAAEAETGARCYFGAPLGERSENRKRIEDALTEVGRSPATRLTAFTDGAPVLRSLAAQVGVRDRPILDWFHIAMRIRHLQVSAAALPTRVPSQAAAKTVVCEGVERLRWKLWHGRPDALGTGVKQIMEGLRGYRYEPHHARRPAASRVARCKLLALEKYVSGQEAWTTNYAERSRQGKRVGTSLAESLAEHLVNRRMNKSQHMRWSRSGARHLLQVRAATMNGRVHPVAQRA